MLVPHGGGALVCTLTPACRLQLQLSFGFSAPHKLCRYEIVDVFGASGFELSVNDAVKIPLFDLLNLLCLAFFLAQSSIGLST